MSNRLKPVQVEIIRRLWQQGWKNRAIARSTGINRNTVNRYVQQWREAASAGAASSCEANAAKLHPGSTVQMGMQSRCWSHRDLIQSKLDQGLSAQRIFQDLCSEHGFAGSYFSVLRFVRTLQSHQRLPFRRMEVGPGEEVQVDFGQGAWIVDGQGKRRRPHLFRMVLSHSRKAYSEVVVRQTADAFLQCLENAFHYFGGVPKTVVIDNLKGRRTAGRLV